jgi:TPP-dependent pyruvate/acetoin dehydrogenase alpha subunit
MGTAISRSQSRTDVASKAPGYGVPAASADGMDVAAVEAAVREAAESVRGGAGPYLLELHTYRFRAHSMYDPELYRTKEEVESWKKRDPIPLYLAAMRAAGILDDAELARVEAEVAADVEAAVVFAAEGPLEPVSDLTRDVYTAAAP